MFLRFTCSTFALLAFAAAPGFSQTIKTVTPNQTSPTSGKQMFTEYCAVCHGPDGRGMGPAAAALKTMPTDLTKLAMHNNGKFPDTRVARYIEGDDKISAHGSSEMPMWGGVFKSMSGSTDITRMRVANLTDYVKSLQTK